MKVSIKDGSDWKTFSVLLKPGQRHKKNMKLVVGRSFPLVGFLVEVADRKELLWLFRYIN